MTEESKMKKWICAVALGIISGSVFAADWVVIAPNGEAYVTYDRMTVKHSGSKIIVWLRYLWLNPTTQPNGQPYDESLMHVVYDCSADTYQGRELINKFKTKLVSTSGPYPIKDIAPDSVASIVETTLCHPS